MDITGPKDFDLLVVGGGINGAGVARDAAGRGLSVLLAEKGDLGCATSSWSSKLIHGGLRYLEYYEFRLVRGVARRARGAAQDRGAPGVAAAIRHAARSGAQAALDDPRGPVPVRPSRPAHHAAGGSQAVRLDRTPYGAGLKTELKHGFVYSDCRVDDARLVIVNAVAAQARAPKSAPEPSAPGWSGRAASGRPASPVRQARRL